ncbi:ECF transporter S component [Paenibacillus durus]|uniref:ECF transporter S component n=1 Tax=Paenibacillus durus TaxID=44251 RepID=UPI0005A7DFAA|nr:ECF transporter S component [Paenibacillus durus]
MEDNPGQAHDEKLSGRLAGVQSRFLFKLGLADVLRFTMFGTMIVVVNDVTRLPLQIPGHTSIFWMAIMLLGAGLIPKFGGGMIMGSVSGVLAVVLGLGKEGIFIFFKYFVPGLVVDLLAPVFFYQMANPFVGVICGALASLSKLFISLLLGLLLQLPMGFLALGLGYTSLTHVAFGAAGGLVAVFLINRLKPRLVRWE